MIITLKQQKSLYEEAFLFWSSGPCWFNIEPVFGGYALNIKVKRFIIN
jgi:hypothetical protein